MPMNCPFCSHLMTKGYIYSPRTLSWSPTPLKSFSEISFRKEGNVVLSETGFLSPAKVIAYHCPSCRNIIIHY